MRNDRQEKQAGRPLPFWKRPAGKQIPGSGTGPLGADPEVPEGMFYRAADFEKEDLWPAVSERLERIGQPGNAAANEEKGRPVRPPMFLFRPVYAALTFLVITGAVLLLIGPGRNAREEAAIVRPTVQSRPQATIDSAYIQGKQARVMTFVQPNVPEISFFWIGSQDN